MMTSSKLTLWVVILHGNNASTGGPGTVHQQLLVHRLESERIHHTDVDPLALQPVVGGDSLLQGHSGTDDSHLVIIRLTDDLVRGGGQE